MSQVLRGASRRVRLAERRQVCKGLLTSSSIAALASRTTSPTTMTASAVIFVPMISRLTAIRVAAESSAYATVPSSSHQQTAELAARAVGSQPSSVAGNPQPLAVHLAKLAQLQPVESRPAPEERREPVVADCTLLGDSAAPIAARSSGSSFIRQAPVGGNGLRLRLPKRGPTS